MRSLLINKIVMLAGSVGVVIALAVLAFLSKKLGEAWGMRPLYRFIYVAGAVIIFRALLLLALPAPVFSSAKMTATGVYTAAITVSLLAAWPYWSWVPGRLRAENGGDR